LKAVALEAAGYQQPQKCWCAVAVAAAFVLGQEQNITHAVVEFVSIGRGIWQKIELCFYIKHKTI